MKRRLITFEGSEGCGKTTQIALLKKRLEARGEKVVVTREPGGTALGEAIRHLLKDAPEGRGMSSATELLLFSASRAELIDKVILPALTRLDWVLCDRFTDSTLVYQGMARRLPEATIDPINHAATSGIKPGLTLVLDLPLEKAAARLRTRATKDRFEEEDETFFTRVKDGFLQLAKKEPERIKVVDADAPPEVVAGEVWKHFTEAFAL